ncbi:uncharacterized protein [Coffea arabica]|uniref:Uncharacterized protein n=1 Tax=Coffea arabica TaxID=13443 RepID=A0ABM4W8E1_COFAR
MKSHCHGPENHRGDQRPSRDGSPGYGPNIVGVINTIAGGPTERDSQNFRKRTYRQANLDAVEPSSRLSKVITYGPSDPVPATSSNHKPLVIEVLTNNYIVKKVYVDPDSLIDVFFAVVKADSPYNMLIGRSTLNALRVVYSTYHLSFKFSTPVEVVEVSSDVNAARECYLATIQAVVTPRNESKAEGKRPTVLSIDSIDS